jgi:hypothetical protein
MKFGSRLEPILVHYPGVFGVDDIAHIRGILGGIYNYSKHMHQDRTGWNDNQILKIKSGGNESGYYPY